MAATHKLTDWLKCFELMVEGYTLAKIAERLNMHVSTAFYWRHKTLNALRSLSNSPLSGIIESDETHFLESETGHRGGIPHRNARKRGRKVGDDKKEKQKRGISKEQVSVVVAYDRNGNIICQMGGRDNYMFWFRFLELNKKFGDADKQKKMLLDNCKLANFTTVLQMRTY